MQGKKEMVEEEEQVAASVLGLMKDGTLSASSAIQREC